MKVSDLMTDKVISIKKDGSLLDAANSLSRYAISGMPVTDDNKLIGIITEYDLIKRLTEYYAPSYLMLLTEAEGGDAEENKKRLLEIGNAAVSEFMTKDVYTVGPENSVADAAKLIIQHDINPLPVVDSDNKVVGIISRSDIMKVVADKKESS